MDSGGEGALVGKIDEKRSGAWVSTERKELLWTFIYGDFYAFLLPLLRKDMRDQNCTKAIHPYHSSLYPFPNIDFESHGLLLFFSLALQFR